MDTQFWQSFEGQTVDGKYRLQHLLGNGAFGGVFLTDETIGGQVIGQVAVKLILPISTNQAAQLDELIAMRNLNHPHVVRGLAAGQCVLNNIKLLYLVMDVAEGTLESRLQAGSVTAAEAKEIVRSIADGLNFLHGKNMVHRALSPATSCASAASGRSPTSVWSAPSATTAPPTRRPSRVRRFSCRRKASTGPFRPPGMSGPSASSSS